MAKKGSDNQFYASEETQTKILESIQTLNLNNFSLNVPDFDPTISRISIAAWTKMITHQKNVLGLTDKQIISQLPKLLKGQALETFIDICSDQENWEDISNLLQKFFPTKREELFFQITQLTWNIGGSLNEYYRNKLSLATKLGLSNLDTVQALTSGLPPHYHKMLQLRHATSPQNWMEAALILCDQVKPNVTSSVKEEFPSHARKSELPPYPCPLCKKQLQQHENWHYVNNCPLKQARNPAPASRSWENPHRMKYNSARTSTDNTTPKSHAS